MYDTETLVGENAYKYQPSGQADEKLESKSTASRHSNIALGAQFHKSTVSVSRIKPGGQQAHGKTCIPLLMNTDYLLDLVHWQLPAALGLTMLIL